MDMLRIVKCILPIGSDDWAEVCKQHNTATSHPIRTADSLQRKFSTLRHAEPPVGSASCPQEVREAKRIRKRIVERVDLADGEDALGVSLSAFGDEESDLNSQMGSSTSQADSTDAPPIGTQDQAQRTVFAARLLVSIRTPQLNTDDDIMQLLKIQVLFSRQEERARHETDELWCKETRELREQDRKDEKERRDEERRQRELKRQEDRKPREAMMPRHEQMMQTMMMLIAKKEQ